MIRKIFSKVFPVLGICCGISMPVQEPEVVTEFRAACRAITCMSDQHKERENWKEIIVKHGQLTDETVKLLIRTAKETLGKTPELMFFEVIAKEAIIDAKFELKRQANQAKKE